jgi:signal transduction histidine kinase
MSGSSQAKRRRHRGSITYRLMFWGLALLAIALVLNIIAGSIYTRRGMQQSAAELQSEVAASMARQIQSYLARKIERLQDRGTAMTLFSIGGEEQRFLSLLLMKNEPSFSEIAILNERGMEVLKFSETDVYLRSDLQDQKSSAAFLAATRGEVYIGPVLTSSRAEPYVTLGVPLKYGPQRIAGVLIAQTNLKFLWEVVRETKFGHQGYAYLVNETGLLIAHPDPSLVLKYLNLHNVSKVRQFLSTRSMDTAPAAEGLGISGQPVLSSYAAIPDLGWALVVEEPLDLFMADLQRLQRYALLLLAVGLASGACIIVWVSRRITKPIRELRAGVETIRGGDLNHRTGIHTGDEIEELAEEFNKMTEALQDSYATLEQKVEQRTKEASALYEVTTAVNQSLDLQTILQAVIAKITEMFHFEVTRVFLFDSQMDRLELRASVEPSPGNGRGARSSRRGEGVVGTVAETGEPLIFEDIYTDPTYAALNPTKPAHAAKRHFFAVFPIKTQLRIFGTIAFHGTEPRTFTDDEIRLLTSMSEHLGVAVEKASLFEEVQTRSQHLAVLHTVSEAVGHSLDLQVVLKEAVEKIADTLRFEACWIYILKEPDRELELKAFQGLSPEMVQVLSRRKLAAGISGLVFQTGQRLVFEDVQTDKHYAKLSATGKVQALGFATSAAFPIRAKDAVIGTLHVVNRIVRHFTAEELQLIEAVAHEIGVAVENARLFAEVNEKTTALAHANQELQEATRAKSEFIAAMSHELRTPLNIIIGNSDLTRDGFFGDLNGDQRNALLKVSRHARVLLKMINDVLTLSRHDAKKMSLDVDTVEVEEIIAHARTHVEQINRDNHIEVEWDVDDNVPPLVTDPLKLEEILQNLIGNAFKFTQRGRIEVRVRSLRDQDRVQFSVADTGIGIDSDNLAKIFNEFEQIKGSHTGGFNGVGLGLNIVKKYLELMQGDIQVESRPGQGSVFTFSLPRAVSSAS